MPFPFDGEQTIGILSNATARRGGRILPIVPEQKPQDPPLNWSIPEYTPFQIAPPRFPKPDNSNNQWTYDDPVGPFPEDKRYFPINEDRGTIWVGDIEWADPLPPPKERPPTKPIVKDPTAEGWPSWWPKPENAPCKTCTYFKFEDQLGAPNPRGGSILFTTAFGTTSLDRYVKIGGEWHDNPMLEKLGIIIDNNGNCKCTKLLNPGDFNVPTDLNDPDAYDCNEKIKNFLLTYPRIEGCDEAVKKRITEAYYEVCKNLLKNANNSWLSQIWEGDNKAMQALASCMTDPSIFSKIKYLECTSLGPGLFAWTKGKIGETQIDLSKIDAFAFQNGENPDELLSYTLLHELTHICCEEASTSEEIDSNGNLIKTPVGCTEVDRVLLGYFLNGNNTSHSLLTAQIDNLCDDAASLQRKVDMNKLFQNVKHQLGKKWVVGANYMIDLSTGDVYALPMSGAWDYINDIPLTPPTTTVPVPPNGYQLCSY